MEDYGVVKQSSNSKVIAMLSGGKDSIATVVLLKKSVTVKSIKIKKIN